MLRMASKKPATSNRRRQLTLSMARCKRRALTEMLQRALFAAPRLSMGNRVASGVDFEVAVLKCVGDDNAGV